VAWLQILQELHPIKAWKISLLLFGATVIAVGLYAASVIRRGFSANSEPSSIERVVARAVDRLGSTARTSRLASFVCAHDASRASFRTE